MSSENLTALEAIRAVGAEFPQTVAESAVLADLVDRELS